MASAGATEPGATADAIADAAYHARGVWSDEQGDEPSLLGSIAAMLDGRVNSVHKPRAAIATSHCHLSEGDMSERPSTLRRLSGTRTQAFDAQSRIAVIAATLAVVDGARGRR